MFVEMWPIVNIGTMFPLINRHAEREDWDAERGETRKDRRDRGEETTITHSMKLHFMICWIVQFIRHPNELVFVYLCGFFSAIPLISLRKCEICLSNGYKFILAIVVSISILYLHVGFLIPHSIFFLSVVRLFALPLPLHSSSTAFVVVFSSSNQNV